MAANPSHNSPFLDPPRQEDTLSVNRDASLTLGTDSLIVLDERLPRRESRNCYGFVWSSTKNTRTIPYFNVLWAELSESGITPEIIIQYARQTSKNVVRVASINYPVAEIVTGSLGLKLDRQRLRSWIERLLERAYGQSQLKKRIKVLVNPFGGKQKASQSYYRDVEPIFAAARCELDVERTEYQGHAVEVAEGLDIEAFDVVASCSGDGLPHEVFNGLGKKPNARRALEKIAVVQLPCGSGNAMSWNLNGTDSTSMAALCIVKGIRTPLDLASVTQDDTRILSFLSQAVGIVAEVDLGTDNLRWMGTFRFSYGFFVRIFFKTTYPCDFVVKVEIPSKAAIKEHFQEEIRNPSAIPGRDTSTSSDSQAEEDPGLPALKHSEHDYGRSELSWTQTSYPNLGSFFCGNMALMAPSANFFPAALPHDGHLDLTTMAGDVPLLSAFRSFFAVENGAKFFDQPPVDYKKVSAYRIEPKGKDGYIAIDGEKMAFKPFQVEVHRGLGTVLSRSGRRYEVDGVI